jgi:hypothetical protein
MWEPSHEWRLAEVAPSLRGFRWFTRKPLGSLVDPQSQDRRTEDGATAAPDRSDLDEIPMFAQFVERGLALLDSNFFKGMLRYYDINCLNLNPNDILHISIFVHFCGVCGYQAPLDFVPQVLPVEAATQHQ